MNTKQLTKMSLCIALLCISAYISFPIPFTPIMITAQTIVINIIALILSPKQSTITVGVYTLLGICGLPVFSGATAGIGILHGPTGGFIIGFIIAAPVISLLKGKTNNIVRYLIVTILGGMSIIYLFGTAQLCILNKMDIKAALIAAVIPFILGDVIKCIVGSYLAMVLNKVLSSRKLGMSD